MAARITTEDAIRRLNEWHPDCTPGEYPRNTHEPWPMTCGQGHECSPTLHDLTSGAGPCKQCGYRMVKQKVSHSHHEAVDILAQIDPDAVHLEPYPGTNKKAWSMSCANGHKCSPRLDAVVSSGYIPCMQCGRVKTSEAHRTTEKEALKSLGLMNLGVVVQSGSYPGSTTWPWPMVCGRGHRCAPSLNWLKKGKSPCVECSMMDRVGATSWSSLARDPNARWSDSNFYVHQVLDDGVPVYKVGMGATSRAFHHGGEVVYLHPCPRGVAFVFEQAVLKASTRHVMSSRLPRGGDTEVIKDLSAAFPLMTELEELDISTESARRDFDNEHFDNCVPIGVVAKKHGQMQITT